MKCKVCGGKTRKFLDLGKQPIANRLLERPEAEEPMYSLILRFCEDCFIVQLEEIVEDTEMFDDDYPFCTSSSAYMVLHFNNLAKTIKNRFLERNESICEIGSNDGTFLRNFKDYNHVGVEPSSGVASKSNGLNVINQFFNERLAEEIVSESGQMDVIVSANVFPHVFDRKDFLRGIRALLKPEGVWINEEAYLDSILSRLSYDQFSAYYFQKQLS